MFARQLLRTFAGLCRLTPVETCDVGEELDLLRFEVAVRSVDLVVDLPRVDEEDSVGAISAPFAFVVEPESAGQRDGVEEV